MKKGFLLSLLVFTTSVFGFQSTNQSTFVFFDLLMWQIREVSDDNWGQILGPTGTNQNIQFLDVAFNWKPGFRAGIGYQSKEIPLDVTFYYTGYKTKGIRQVSIDSGGIHPAFSGNFYAKNVQGEGVSGPYYHQAGIQWNVLFNTLDLELGHAVDVNKLLKLRPYVGLKASRINQTIKSDWHQPFQPTTFFDPAPTPITTFSSATETITNDFSGFGPSFGLDTTWHLLNTTQYEFNFLGDVAGAFLWGKWTLTDKYQNNTPVSITVLNDTLSTAAPMMRGYLGVEWRTVLDKVNLNIRLGYEGQIWFNQLRYYSFDMGKLNNALTLQGGVLDFSIHF